MNIGNNKGSATKTLNALQDISADNIYSENASFNVVSAEDANIKSYLYIPTMLTNPTDPAEIGDMVFARSTNRLYIYNGTQWRYSNFSA